MRNNSRSRHGGRGGPPRGRRQNNRGRGRFQQQKRKPAPRRPSLQELIAKRRKRIASTLTKLGDHKLKKIEPAENFPTLQVLICDKCDKSHSNAKRCDGSTIKEQCTKCNAIHSIAITCKTFKFRTAVRCDKCNLKHKPEPYTCEDFKLPFYKYKKILCLENSTN